jgi:hypothetical protein
VFDSEPEQRSESVEKRLVVSGVVDLCHRNGDASRDTRMRGAEPVRAVETVPRHRVSLHLLRRPKSKRLYPT